MKLERFTNPYELEDYLKVMILSMYDGKRKHKPITRFFRQEITRAFEHTAKLDDNYEINKGNWVLYALRNDITKLSVPLQPEKTIISAAAFSWNMSPFARTANNAAWEN